MSKNITEVEPHKSERSNEDVIARDDSSSFFVYKIKERRRRRRRLQKKCARTGFGVIVVIATDATSAAFVKTSRRSTFVSTVLRSMSFSCLVCVDFDTDAHTKGGGGGLLEDEKRLFVVVLLVGVEMTTMLLVAAANIL